MKKMLAITCALAMAFALAVATGCSQPAQQNTVKTVKVVITAGEGFDAETCSKAILFVKDGSGDKKVLSITPGEDASIELEDGTYEVSGIWPIAPDGSIFRPAADATLSFKVDADHAEFSLELYKTTLTAEELGTEFESVKQVLSDNGVDEETASKVLDAYQKAYDTAIAAKAEAEAKAAAEAEAANASSGYSGGSNYSSGGSSARGSSEEGGTSSSSGSDAGSSGGETIDYGVQKNTQTDNPEGVAGDKALGDEINKVFG